MSYTQRQRPHITRSRHSMGGVIFIGRRFDDALRLAIYGTIVLCTICIVLLAIAYGRTP